MLTIDQFTLCVLIYNKFCDEYHSLFVIRAESSSMHSIFVIRAERSFIQTIFVIRAECITIYYSFMICVECGYFYSIFFMDKDFSDDYITLFTILL